MEQQHGELASGEQEGDSQRQWALCVEAELLSHEGARPALKAQLT